MERFIRRSKVGVGIDIGTSQIKVVACMFMDGEIQVADAWMLPVPSPEDERHATFREEASRFFQDAIRKVWGLGDVVVAASVPASQATLSMIPLAPVLAGPAEGPRLLDIEPYLPFPSSEANYDIQRFSSLPGRLSEIFLAAIRKEMAEDYCQEMASIGVEPQILDVTALANANLIAPRVPDGQVVAVVDIGAQSVEVVLLEGQRFRGVHSIARAGDDLTDALTVDFLGDMQRAEAAKHERGLLDADLRPAVRRWRDAFLHAVAKAIATCETEHKLQRLDRVVLFGGGAAIRGLRSALEEFLETPTAIGNPWHSLQVAQSVLVESHPAFSAATGLAIRALGKGIFQINLRSKRRPLSSGRRMLKTDTISFAIWGGAVLALLIVLGLASLSIQGNYLSTLERTLRSLQAQAAQILQEEQVMQQRRLAQNKLLRLEGEKPRWSSLLQTIFASLPPGVSLQGLSWEKGKEILLSGESPSYTQAAIFISKLEHTRRFGSVTLQQTGKRGSGIAFTLGISLSPGKGGNP